MCAKNKEKKAVAKCPHCDANMYIHRHRLSKGLVNSLIKMKRGVIEMQKNQIHLQSELVLSKNDYNNFQKLRYHGLVAKCIDSETKERLSGYWLLTKRGNEFLKNMVSLPLAVYTFRNKIVNKHPDRVRLSDVLSNDELPYWDKDFIHDYADVHDIEEIKFDINGQGLLFS
jgi:hypothetical protein